MSSDLIILPHDKHASYDINLEPAEMLISVSENVIKLRRYGTRLPLNTLRSPSPRNLPGDHHPVAL
jgi:hypothetical protein